MEAQLKNGSHHHHEDVQISGAQSVAAGGNEPKVSNHCGASAVKKSKARAKWNKDKMKKQGRKHDDDGIEKIPEVHGAPIYESTVTRANLENPTKDRYHRRYLKSDTGLERLMPEKENVQSIPNLTEMEEMKVVEPAVKIEPSIVLGKDSNAIDPSFQEGYKSQFPTLAQLFDDMNIPGESKTTEEIQKIKPDSNLKSFFNPQKPQVETAARKIMVPPVPAEKEISPKHGQDQNCSAAAVSKSAAEYGRMLVEKVAGAGRAIASKVKRGGVRR